MTTSSDLLCGVCNKIKAAHEGMNHEFNVDGQLIPRQEPKVIQKSTGADVVLRLLLVQHGLLTSDDINGMEQTIRDQLAQAGRNAADPPDGGTAGGDSPPRS